jgi:hypothetical protein
MSGDVSQDDYFVAFGYNGTQLCVSRPDDARTIGILA